MKNICKSHTISKYKIKINVMRDLKKNYFRPMDHLVYTLRMQAFAI